MQMRRPAIGSRGSGDTKQCHLQSIIIGIALCLPLILMNWFDEAISSSRIGSGISISSSGFPPRGGNTVRHPAATISACPKCSNDASPRKEIIVQQSLPPPQQHSAASVPMLPLQHCVKYTQRKTDQLSVIEQTVDLPGQLKPVRFAFLDDADGSENEELYDFKTYKGDAKGAVTHLWTAILQRILQQEASGHYKGSPNQIVLDGGMKTGFFTALTASLGFPVHSFDLQRDCFDIAQKVLDSNPPAMRKFAHLYNMGLSDKETIVRAGEGCKSQGGRSTVQQNAETSSSHLIPVISLDVFLDQMEVAMSYLHQRPDPSQQQRRLAESSEDDDDHDDDATNDDSVDAVDPAVDDSQSIAILNLDIASASTQGLQGFVKYLPTCENIVLELAQQSSTQVPSIEDTIYQYKRLERDGFDAYMLYTRGGIPANKGKNVTFLQEAGLAAISKHPVLETPMSEISDYRMIWKVTDWNLFAKVACPVSCNMWFHRARPSPNKK